MNNKQNDLLRRAMEKIRCDKKCKPNCYGVIGATGPTDTYDYFFNKINRNYSSIFYFKHIEKQVKI